MNNSNLPNHWELKPLSSVVSDTTGGYGFPRNFQGRHDLPYPFAKVSDMNLPGNETYITSAENTVDDAILNEIRAKTYSPGTIIFPKIGGAIATNKKRILGVEATFDNNVMAVVPDEEKAITKWIFYYLQSIDLMTLANIGPVPSIRQSTVQALPIPIPYPDDPPRSLDVQRRIVARIEALLAEVREMRELQADIASNTDKLLASAIQQVFEQNQDSWITEDLSNVAYVQTGTAKGRRYGDRATIELPYLRVANVQAGYLDLSEIKTILIAEDEIDRYRLQVGDLLLTEGGDYDKLGRGSVWMGEIDPCIHQNHVFAVRFDQSKVLPRFAEYEMQSEYAKQYFLKVAKKTTNLASINKTQLSAFPLKYPSNLREQQYIIEYLDRIKSEVSDMQNIETTDTELIGQLEQAILAQAFRGEL